VFLISGLAKIGDQGAFALQLHNFRMMPIWSENLMAMTLPWIELVAGLCLVSSIRPRAGAAVATLLSVVFLIAVGVAMARGLDIECGCFGTADATRVGFGKLGENLAYCFLAITGVQRGGNGR
jgi:uncharacterized membrane protein YphA (DoxX/SURF4 family)